MALSLLVGRCLGVGRSVSSDSFVFAGKSYNMKCFCESIYVDLLTRVPLILPPVAPPIDELGAQSIDQSSDQCKNQTNDQSVELPPTLPPTQRQGTGSDSDSEEALEADEDGVGVRGGILETNLLRFCALKCWHQRLCIEERPYNVDQMTTTWLSDAVSLYSDNIAFWALRLQQRLVALDTRAKREGPS